MKDSALLLLAGVLLCVFTIAGVVLGAPKLLITFTCFAGTNLIISALYEMIVNHN